MSIIRPVSTLSRLTTGAESGGHVIKGMGLIGPAKMRTSDCTVSLGGGRSINGRRLPDRIRRTSTILKRLPPLSPLSSNSCRSGAAFPQNLRVWDGLDGPRGQHRPLIMLLGPSVEGVGGGRKIETLRCAPINPRRERPSPILLSPSPTRFPFPFHSSEPLFHSAVPLYPIFCHHCCSSLSPLFPILSIVPFLPKYCSCFMSSYPCLSVLVLVLSQCLIVL